MAPSSNDPRSLIGCTLDELRDAVRAVPMWTESNARQLDQALRGRVVDALAGTSDVADLAALERAVRTLVPHTLRPTLRALDEVVVLEDPEEAAQVGR